MKDYFKIDEEYGTADDLKNFVKTAHRHGLKVLFDLVYYHCGPTADFLNINKNFVRRLPDGTPDCGEWRFPKLNYECAELREYLYGNMEYLIKEYDVDGFRCDVGDHVPLDFWAEGRKRIENVKPNMLLINEGGHPDFIKSGVFDINYHLSWGEDTLLQFKEKFTKKIGTADMANRKLICFENHDAVNDASDLRIDKKHGTALCNALLALIFTCGCIPFIYNGNEIGDTMRHSIYGNRFYGKNMYVDWSETFSDRGKERMTLIRNLCDIYHNISSITDGKTVMLYDKNGLISFLRTNDKDTLLVAANLNEDIKQLTLDPKYTNNAEKLLSDKAILHGKELILESGGFLIMCKTV